MPQQPMNRSKTRRPGQSGLRAGFPIWICPLIMVLTLVTGTAISVDQQQIGVVYLGLFAAAALGCTLTVCPRGLWLTVTGMPLFFGVATPIAAWTVARSTAAEGSDAFSTTGIVTAIYPLAQHFPVLAATTVGCILIAILRLARVRKLQIAAQRTHRQTRRKLTVAEQRNIAAASRARRIGAARDVDSRARREKIDGDTRPTVAELRQKALEEKAAAANRKRPRTSESPSDSSPLPRRRPSREHPHPQTTGDAGRHTVTERASIRRPTENSHPRTPRPRLPERTAGTTDRPIRVRPAPRPGSVSGASQRRPDLRRDRYMIGETARGRIQDPRGTRSRHAESSEYPRDSRQRRAASRPLRSRDDRPAGNGPARPQAPAPGPSSESSPEPEPRRRPTWLDDDLYT
ncbi:DUF6542 domain-containing protein [Corynebacterium sp. CCM 9204]|uniref:DUF6542 domain-containing protein n=1 Tax=Corynebacterium sp. CCM 9204 TaxID=3057616 RepID=UPI003523A1D7